MNKTFITLCVAALLVGSGLYLAHAQADPKPGDARLDKIIEQNELILKNQAEIKQTLDGLKQDLLQLRRRSS